MIDSRRADDSDYWYRQDTRGSVTNIVDATDSVVKSYTYDAYGNTQSTGTFINSFAYTGAVIDTETCLYYMNARYYDPETGRFISQDTYRGSGDAFWHSYLYCEGDPVNATDPSGHGDKDKVIAYIKKSSLYIQGQQIIANLKANSQYVVNDSKITIDNLRKVKLESKEAYKAYKNNVKVKAKFDSFTIALYTTIFTSPLGPIKGILVNGVLNGVATFVVEPKWDKSFKGQMAGTYLIAKFTYKFDYDCYVKGVKIHHTKYGIKAMHLKVLQYLGQI